MNLLTQGTLPHEESALESYLLSIHSKPVRHLGGAMDRRTLRFSSGLHQQHTGPLRVRRLAMCPPQTDQGERLGADAGSSEPLYHIHVLFRWLHDSWGAAGDVRQCCPFRLAALCGSCLYGGGLCPYTGGGSAETGGICAHGRRQRFPQTAVRQRLSLENIRDSVPLLYSNPSGCFSRIFHLRCRSGSLYGFYRKVLYLPAFAPCIAPRLDAPRYLFHHTIVQCRNPGLHAGADSCPVSLLCLRNQLPAAMRGTALDLQSRGSLSDSLPHSEYVCLLFHQGHALLGGVVLLTTLLLELARDPDAFWSLRQKKILLSCAMLFLLFFRNNGIYALVVFLFFFAILHRRSWKKWFPTVAVTFLIYFVVFQVLVLAFHATKGPLAEMFCVPIQQLARVYVQAGDTLPAEDREVLFTLIPQIILEQYNPKLADTVKINFLEDNFRAAPMKYVSLWFRTGLKHFDIYVNAFLENTYGYWYPDTVLDGYRGIWTAGRQYGDSSYFAFSTDHPGRRMSLLPALEKFYEKISLEIYQQKIPVLSMLFSVGFWHWVYLCTAFYLLATGYKGQAFSLAPIGLLYLTVLLGPIALVRYVLYLFFTVPLILALLLDPGALGGRAVSTPCDG